MKLGYQLVREQLFFRKELIERVYWFIHLRWIAAGAGFVSGWAVYFFIEPAFPIIPVHIVLICVILYNSLFYAVHKTFEVRILIRFVKFKFRCNGVIQFRRIRKRIIDNRQINCVTASA